ncbi:hypothetical protein AB0L41_09660 [Amycolatopsis mediterranei]|uniref:hypothetical protein n=1 Tax=Amycolatopsis mediterranei TaxID=33910 RepID=UPI0034306BE0
MDENYARKLRNWLRAEPGATPGGTPEEREWLREIPEPATDEQADTPDRWTVRGQLPEPPAADDEWICPVITLPVPRSSRENGCRISGIEIRWSPPARVDGRVGTPGVSRMSDAEARSRWSHPTNVDRRAEAPDASRMSGAEANHPTNADCRAEAPPSAMTDAEARSRWNHPTNWHRRRRAAEDQRRDQPGSH